MIITSNITHLQKTKLATILSILFIADSHASFVRSDIDYQYFRDLAENKGQFHIGATNVPIFNKEGQQIGTMLNGVPMPDLRIVSRKDGVSTLVSSQFINSVKHNKGINSAEFGGVDNNSDSHHFKYNSSSKHFYPHADLHDPDYQLQRLEKLVTEVAPIPMATAGTDSAAYLDNSRFPSFLRVGSGRQWLRNEAGENTLLVPAYKFLTAGVPLTLANAKNSRINAKGKLTDNVYGPMASYAASGDSGSALFGFDKKENRWVLIGLAESNFGNNGSQNGYILARPNYLTEVENAHKIDINNTKANGKFTWNAEQKSGNLKTPTGKVEKIDLFDSAQTDKNAALDHGKNVYFNGQKGVLTLENNINQGAGYLRFNTDFTVNTKDGSQTWLGSGLDIAQGKTVHWAVKNPVNDRLSKIGAGQLIINGEGKNQGNISIGDGTVILSQRPDAQGNQQAFNQIGIVSGRPTVVIAGENQFNPDNLYFGFRGGRLDLNGHNINFSRIQHTDDGARIVNNDPNKISTLTINGKKDSKRKEPDSFIGFLGEYNATKHNGRLNVNYSPANNQLLLLTGGTKLNGEFTITNGQVLLSGKPVSHARDMINNQDVIRDNEWINRQFEAKNFVVRQNGELYVGRNVDTVSGQLSAFSNGKISLGVIEGQTPSCIRSEHTGKVSCDMQGVRSSLNSANMPKTTVTSTPYTYLNHNSTLEIGNAHLKGKIFAYHNSQVTMHNNSQWTMPGSSMLQHLAMHNGSEINLHPEYHSVNDAQVKKGVTRFNNLTINGNLTGVGQFNFLTNAALGKGDLLTVNGLANGHFALGVKHTGAEPKNASPLQLVRLLNKNQVAGNANFYLRDNFVDLGAYRYILKNENNEYRLYSPMKEAVLKSSNNLAQQKQIEQEAIANAENKKLAVIELQKSAETKLKTQQQTENALAAQQNAISAENAKAQNYRAQARYTYSSYRRRQLLTLSQQAINRMRAAQASASNLQQQLNTSKNELLEIRKAIDVANQVSAQAEKALLDAKQHSSAIQAIKQKTDALCQQHQIDAATCGQLKQAKQLISEDELALSMDKVDELENAYNEQLNSLNELKASTKNSTLIDNDIAQAEKQLANLSKQLENAKDEQAEIIHSMLDKSPAPIAVRQADFISQYANSALSDLSAQANNLTQVRQSIHQRLLAKESTPFSVWSEYQVFDNNYHSDQFRRYGQNSRLTQIGVEGQVNDDLRMGAVLSHSNSQNQFDDHFAGKSRLQMLSAYAKATLPNEFTLAFEASYGQAKNKLSQGDVKTGFKRHIYQTGVTLAKMWQTPFVDIQPSVSAHYNRLSSTNYELDRAKVNQGSMGFMSYQLGLKLSKDFVWNDVTLTPHFESQFISSSNKKVNIKVNNNNLTQKFARYSQHQIGLETKFKQWSASVTAGLLNGNQASYQKQFGFNLKYSW